jgi:hypothetical protein
MKRARAKSLGRGKACRVSRDCAPHQVCVAEKCVSDIRDPFVLARTGARMNGRDRHGLGAALQRYRIGLMTSARAGASPAAATGLGGDRRPRSGSYCFYYRGRLCCIFPGGFWECAHGSRCRWVKKGRKLVRECSMTWRVPGG